MPALLRMPLLKRGLRRFGANRTGSAAVEFALVAMPFFALLLAIMEVAMLFFATQILETGTQETARQLLTHQAQDQKWTADDAHADLCTRIKALLACDGITIDVRSYPAGEAFTVPAWFDAAGNAITENFVYEPPPANSSNIVVVRAFYKWPLFITNLGFSLANIGTDQRLLVSTVAFRVEPSPSSS